MWVSYKNNTSLLVAMELETRYLGKMIKLIYGHHHLSWNVQFSNNITQFVFICLNIATKLESQIFKLFRNVHLFIVECVFHNALGNHESKTSNHFFQRNSFQHGLMTILEKIRSHTFFNLQLCITKNNLVYVLFLGVS